MKKDLFKAVNYDFKVPEELIAQKPAQPRDSSRLLVLKRKNSQLLDKKFKDILSFFQKGDCLVLNNTKVIKARIFGQKETGAKIEVLLIKELERGCWECLIKPAKRVKKGNKILFKKGYAAEIREKTSAGLYWLQFIPEKVENLIKVSGQTPLPPYIKKKSSLDMYQTVYAKKTGAIAAPTAGLHFTEELIERIKNRGVNIIYVTLHCSLGTFRPVKAKNIQNHLMEKEFIEITSKAAEEVNKAKKNGKKIFAVGTTAVRSLESASQEGCLKPFWGETSLYITPGYQFKMVDALLTNFHTPLSTNLILVTAFSSLELIKQAYAYAQAKKFRFFTFGDAMLIL